MRKIFIYKIFIPETNKSYIGETFDVENRIKKHFKVAKEGYKSEFYDDLLKYPNNIQIEILEETTNDNRRIRESYWIEYYDTFNNGYNRTFKDGYNRCNCTNETKQKEAARKYANSKYNAWKTPVLQKDVNDNIIKIFNSITEAGEYLKLNKKEMTKVLNDKIFIGEYYYQRGEKLKKEKIIKEKSKYGGIKIKMFKDEKLIKTFDSITHCMSELNLTRRQVDYFSKNKILINDEYYIER